MNGRIQIYIDEKGKRSSVLLPYEDWQNLKSRLNRLEKKLKVFTSIRDGMNEVAEAKRTDKKLQSLSAFIDESRN